MSFCQQYDMLLCGAVAGACWLQRARREVAGGRGDIEMKDTVMEESISTRASLRRARSPVREKSEDRGSKRESVGASCDVHLKTLNI